MFKAATKRKITIQYTVISFLFKLVDKAKSQTARLNVAALRTEPGLLWMSLTWILDCSVFNGSLCTFDFWTSLMNTVSVFPPISG